MTTDLQLAAWAIALTWLMVFSAGSLRANWWTPSGMKLALGNRHDMPTPTPLAERADRAAKNMLENVILFLGLIVASFRSARRVETRAARTPSMRDLAILASGVQIALVAFLVGAFFAPIAYQFYFFCVAGLAVALKNACRREA